MKISYTWENVDQPDDEKIAGIPWLYISTYQEFHNGLVASRQELQKYSALIDEFELESSTYDKEKRRLEMMIKC